MRANFHLIFHCIGAFLVFPVQVLSQATKDARPEYTNLVKAITDKIPNLETASPSKELLNESTGSYANPGKLVQRYIGPVLAGHIITLSGDHTYRHEYWADILQRRTCDQGSWQYEDRTIRLRSDGSIKGIAKLDDVIYAPMYLKRGSERTLLLIGTEKGAQQFLAAIKAGDDNESREMSFLAFAYEKAATK